MHSTNIWGGLTALFSCCLLALFPYLQFIQQTSGKDLPPYSWRQCLHETSLPRNKGKDHSLLPKGNLLQVASWSALSSHWVGGFGRGFTNPSSQAKCRRQVKAKLDLGLCWVKYALQTTSSGQRISGNHLYSCATFKR